MVQMHVVQARPVLHGPLEGGPESVGSNSSADCWVVDVVGVGDRGVTPSEHHYPSGCRRCTGNDEANALDGELMWALQVSAYHIGKRTGQAERDDHFRHRRWAAIISIAVRSGGTPCQEGACQVLLQMA